MITLYENNLGKWEVDIKDRQEFEEIINKGEGDIMMYFTPKVVCKYINISIGKLSANDE